MTEINEIHSLSLEWGAILNLATRIADIEERIGPWDDLTNMVASLFDNHRTSSPEILASQVYPYLFRLYFRLRSFSVPVPFNQVFEETRSVPTSSNVAYHTDQQGFRIYNYDFSIYHFAISLKQDDFIDNASLWISASVLTPAQLKRFKEKSGRMREKNA